MMRFTLCLILPLLIAAAPATSPSGTRGMVATVHPLATAAGFDALRRGGNAVDAAVAAALTLGVVDGHNSGVGGGCFLLARLADGSFIALDGREVAGAAATRDMFLRDGKALSHLSTTGALASGVPGSLVAYDQALAAHGKLKLRDLLLPAAELAEKGFDIDERYAGRIKSVANDLVKFPASAAILLKEDGKPLAKGSLLRQADLATSYRAIAEHGIDWFYRGPFARSVEQWMRANGGILTAADFAAYRVIRREPLVTTYRGHTIVGFPPPSSGGVHVAQILNILERFDLKDLEERDPALRIHVTAEAMKLAFADRAHWLGDPAFAKVPRGLVDAAYGAELARRISFDRVMPVPSHGTPPRVDEDIFGKHTTHVAAADEHGNWVALTATLNTAFGSKVIVPTTGILLNNQMDDFAVQPGVPNYFGLVGSDANAIAPGKRPLSSMSPTLILKGDQPIMTAGAAGGPKIISQVVLAITNHLDLGDGLRAALARPRFHHQWAPAELWVEKSMPKAIRLRLESLGHKLDDATGAGATQAIGVARDGALIGVREPRMSGTVDAIP